MAYSNDDFEKEISNIIENPHFNEVKCLNESSILTSDVKRTLTIVQKKVTEVTTELVNHTNVLSPGAVLETIASIGQNVEKLDSKLQSNLRMIKQNEGLMTATSSILEFDTAKTRTDVLVKVLKAKIQWVQTFKELQLVEKSDSAEIYQKLVSLQLCYDVLSEYYVDEHRQMDFEKAKDEFLSWKGSATLFNIKDQNFQKLTEIEDCYRCLGRIHEFRRIFGLFVRNEFKEFLAKREKDENPNIWNIFDALTDIWKHVATMGRFVNDGEGNPFRIVSDNLYEVAIENWDNFAANAFTSLEAATDPLKAARDVSKDRQSVLAEINNCSDSHFSSLLNILFDKVNEKFGSTYSRIATSALLRAINVIEMPAKGSRRKASWFPSQLEPLQTMMVDVVHNASHTFGSEFPKWIVPSLEVAFRELQAKMTNHDFFRIKPLTQPDNQPQKQLTDVEEVAQNELTFVVGIGSVLQLFDNVNLAIQASSKLKNNATLVSNRNLLERLNKKVVNSKAVALAKSITVSMMEGMNEMKAAVNPVHSSAAKLPRFSRAPHNYILGVGHGFLSQMKVISSYSNEPSFVNSVITAAGGNLSEDEAGTWFLNQSAQNVMNTFCRAVGDLKKLPEHIQIQLKADIGYFIDAAKDLRLDITPELTAMNEALNE